MPTRHSRISVVRDPELGDALRHAAAHLSSQTEAARLRELALIGARTLDASEGRLEKARRALDRLGATHARGDLLVISRRLRRRHRGVETPSQSLDWARGPH